MERKGLNQASLSKELGVSRTIVSQWMRGIKYPRPDKLLKLGRLLGLDFKEIVVSIPTPDDPIIAFRKKGKRKTKADHIQRGKEVGYLLKPVVPYYAPTNLVQPPVLVNPTTEYHYIQRVVSKIRKEIKASKECKIKFESFISKFNEFSVVLVPVFGGDKHHHENALHVYLPDSNTTWIFLNLDSKILDFKFWMAHELGHVLSPSLQGDEAEDFAEFFAQNLLFPEKYAKEAYKRINASSNEGQIIKYIIKLAEDIVISPITIFESVKSYASAYDFKMPMVGRNLYAATTNLSKGYKTVTEILFEDCKISSRNYIKVCEDVFDTPFFKILKDFLSENEKSPSFIQTLLDTNFQDAKTIYSELV